MVTGFWGIHGHMALFLAGELIQPILIIIKNNIHKP